jgi:hypothetical protein
VSTVIVSDGTPEGTKVLVDGEPVKHVRGLTFSHYSGEYSQLEVELSVVELQHIGLEPTFLGLEEVPTEALEQELARRREDDA